MEYKEQLKRRGVPRKEMMTRVARFSKLKGFDGGLPDSRMPGCERTLFNVIGFQPPKGEGDGMQSPVGAQASRMAAIKISEGFNLGYCKALPGKGPMLHNHDTNETFIAMTGTWRASWVNEKGRLEHVDLKPLDLISFPAGASRRFMNVTKGPKNRESVLMFVIGGDAPRAEFTSESMAAIAKAGVLDAAPARARAKSAAGAARTAARPAAARRRSK
ncbi:MAG: cupin domain-containing protein [Burkholderiales bacterium]|nr:cupin domain-containing protein [Burkholderiales bacterium]